MKTSRQELIKCIHQLTDTYIYLVVLDTYTSTYSASIRSYKVPDTSSYYYQQHIECFNKLLL